MTMEQGFTRKQAMELTKCTSSHLQHLERTNLVIPTKITEGRVQPQVYYVWNQILQIKIIRNLRENTSLTTIRKIIDFFGKCEELPDMGDRCMVTVNDNLLWVKHDLSDLRQNIATIEESDREIKGIGAYNLIVLPTVWETTAEILDTARTCTSISFESVMAKRDSQRQALLC